MPSLVTILNTGYYCQNASTKLKRLKAGDVLSLKGFRDKGMILAMTSEGILVLVEKENCKLD